jgi:hypothetical protein
MDIARRFSFFLFFQNNNLGIGTFNHTVLFFPFWIAGEGGFDGSPLLRLNKRREKISSSAQVLIWDVLGDEELS